MSHPLTERFPGLAAAAKEIAYDNGMVHVGTTEKHVVERMLWAIDQAYQLNELTQVNDHLLSLSKEKLHELCCGEQHMPVTAFDSLVEGMLHVMFMYEDD